MYIRRLLGKILSVISHKRWAVWFDKFVRDEDLSKYAGIPAGRNLYYGESHPVDVFLPPIEGLFEGRKVWLPASTDKYLKRLYHDYMKMPPVDKRESHFIVDLKLPQKYFEQN